MTIAKGLRTGRDYTPSEIDDPALYDQMSNEPLIGEHDVTVVPVRRKDTPHFRRLGLRVKVRDLLKKPDTTRHDQTILELLTLLDDQKKSFEVTTRVFSEKKNASPKEQMLCCSRTDINVQWFTENRMRFDDFTCIQPDISARDITRMSPTGASPAIIIEVIDKHYPEPETFEKLMALSRSAHHVHFYILGTNDLNKSQRLNSFTTTGSRIRIRFAFALLNGELVKNSKVQELGIIHPKDVDAVGYADLNRRQALDAAYYKSRAEKARSLLIDMANPIK